MRTIAIGALLLALTACGSAKEEPAVGPPARNFSVGTDYGIDFDALVTSPADGPVANDERFHDALRKAAAVYASEFGNVDDVMRFAPTLCSLPPKTHIHVSASQDEATHGRKLYWLYAKDRDAYLAVPAGGEQPVGQVLVKEAFVAEPGRGEDDAASPRWERFAPYVERDGAYFHAGAKEGLYVLLKLDPGTDGTDTGWVYGTLTPDGATVTSAGRVASCMGCHTEGTTDRLFGLPPQ